MNKKIKIMFGLPGLAIGGLEKQVVEQLHFFDREKYDITVITLFDYGQRPTFYNQIPAWVGVKKFDFKGYFDFKNLTRLFFYLRLKQPDLLLSSMFSANNLFRILKPFLNYKLITREHNTYIDRARWQIALERIMAPLGDAIVAVSSGVADFYSKQIGMNRAKIKVINNGINLDNFVANRNKQNLAGIKKELNIADDNKIVINVARLKKQKNHKLLIDAFLEFARDFSKYRLIIVGDGAEKADLTEYISKLNASDKVKLLGYRQDTASLYAISEIFVLTSTIEGFPNVFLEALASGLPIITTNVPGVQETIRNDYNGLVVSNDIQDIVAALKKIVSMSDEERLIWRRNARNSVQQFHVQNIVKQYESLFYKLLNIVNV